jgi:hypothetical protein
MAVKQGKTASKGEDKCGDGFGIPVFSRMLIKTTDRLTICLAFF